MKAYAITVLIFQSIAGISHLYDFTTKKFPIERAPLSFNDLVQWGIIFWGLWVVL